MAESSVPPVGRLGITEDGIRRTVEKYKRRFPYRGDFFTLDQVELLLAIIDYLRARESREDGER